MHDMPEDTTVPYARKIAEPRPAGADGAQHVRARPGQRDPLRHRRRPGAGRRGDHGRRLGRPAPDRRSGPAGRARRGGRGGVPVHARRPAGRRAAAQGLPVPAAPGGSLHTVRPGRHPGRDQQLQGVLDRLRPRGRHRQPDRVRDRARADREGDAGCGGRSPRSRRSGSTGSSASPTSDVERSAQLPALVPVRVRRGDADALRAARTKRPARPSQAARDAPRTAARASDRAADRASRMQSRR